MLLPSLLCLAVGALPGDLMPEPADYTFMSWADGWPPNVSGAPWLRCIQTGRFALALNTETLGVEHFGRLDTTLDYRTAALADNTAWRGLPPADLKLAIDVDGRTYRCRSGAPWSQYAGPRLIESGRFVQRGDVTGLVFTSDDGAVLNADARLETVAWPDRLALILAAKPGVQAIPAGEPCFGKVGGGYGLDGRNHLEVVHAPELEPERLTLELWVYVPPDYRASQRVSPWVVCKSGNEWVDGNYGLMLINDRFRACLNLGGGRDNAYTVDATSALAVERWHHVAMTYDSDRLRLYVDGKAAGERQIGRERTTGQGGLAFGRRQDNSGDGYHFRGVIDEVRLYDRALSAEQVQTRAQRPAQPLPGVTPVRAWLFDAAGQAAETRPSERWRRAALSIAFTGPDGPLTQRWELPAGETWDAGVWRETALVVLAHDAPEPEVSATDAIGSAGCPVDFDAGRGWHRINLDKLALDVPEGGTERQNDAVQRVRLTLRNPSAKATRARLLFEKTNGRGPSIGAPITGVSAYLRDADGRLIGLPVQLSKNWHTRPEGGMYAGTWFHGFSQVRLPPGATVELELDLVHGHYEGVAAASHAQLCLIGWGSNQRWDQSALGAWGESICYEPDQCQAQAAVLDVRPLMVRSMGNNQTWGWTNNVGGGDFFRYFDPAGQRVFSARMRTAYLWQCPVLTEVLYAGRSSDGKIEHQATVSLGRSDDIVRGIYRLRMDVRETTPFSRFVIAQIGADTYSYTGERRIAVGNETGLLREWDTQWGGGAYRTKPMEAVGDVPWVSLHQAVSRARNGVGAWANRGLIIRSWQARLDGQPASPWFAEYGVKARGSDTSTIDLVPPPGITQFEPGDFVEATIEHVIMPQYAADYYGPNQNLKVALERDQDTWRMIQREAIGNDLRVSATVGTVTRRWPPQVQAVDDRAEFTIEGGLGYMPLTVAGVSRLGRPVIELRTADGWQPLAGADGWQVDHDAVYGVWEMTVGLPLDTPGDVRQTRALRFRLEP